MMIIINLMIMMLITLTPSFNSQKSVTNTAPIDQTRTALPDILIDSNGVGDVRLGMNVRRLKELPYGLDLYIDAGHVRGIRVITRGYSTKEGLHVGSSLKILNIVSLRNQIRSYSNEDKLFPTIRFNNLTLHLDIPDIPIRSFNILEVWRNNKDFPDPDAMIELIPDNITIKRIELF